MNIIERLFDALVVVQVAALFFFGIAIVLRRLTPEPIERIRITMTAFCATFAMFFLVMLPFVPRWSIAVWHESPSILQEQPFSETTPQMVSPLEMTSQTKTLVSEDNTPLQKRQVLNIANEPAVAAQTFAETTPTPFHWLSLVQGCVIAGSLAVSLLMIVFHFVALVRLRRLMQTTASVPEWVEQLFRDQVAGCRNKISVRVSSQIDSPLMFGLSRPVILLPMSMTHEENMTQTRYALAHEWAHHQHGDLATWCFVHFCRLLFWTQPFYWHLAKELRVDQDFLADDTASQSNFTPNTEAEHYALVLLELAKRRIMNTSIGQSPALGFADTSPLLSRRIEMLLKEKNRLRRKCRWLCLLTVCVLFFGLAVILGSVRLTKTVAGEVQAPPKAETIAQPANDEYQFGIVTDAETGKPLADATVTLYYRDAKDKKIQSIARKSNTEGKYFFPLLSTINNDKKSWSVPRVTKDGYAPETSNWFPIYFENEIKNGTNKFDFKMLPSDPVTGRLVDEEGKPLANILVNGYRWNSENIWGNDGRYPQFDLRSDENGRFKVDVPQNHHAAIWAIPDNLVIKQTIVKEKHGDLGDLVLESGIRPTVKVLDKDGQPLAKTWVDATRVEESHLAIPMMTLSRRSALTDENGMATFLPVAASKYEIRVSEIPSGYSKNSEFPENMVWTREDSESLRQPVRGTFYIEYVDLSPESPTATIQAQKTVKVNVHYLDGKDERTRQVNTRISHRRPETDSKWFVVPKSTHSPDGYLGNGKFSFDVPVGLKDADIHVYSGEDYVCTCSLAGEKTPLPSGDQSGYFLLGTIDKEMNIEVACYKSPKLKVRVESESGEPIQDYFIFADDASNDPPKFEMQEDTIKITTKVTWYEFKWSDIPHTIPWTNPLIRFMYDDYEKSNVQHNNVSFLPDKEMKLYVFAKGYEPSEQTLPKMTEGEEREIAVTLQKAK